MISQLKTPIRTPGRLAAYAAAVILAAGLAVSAAAAVEATLSPVDAARRDGLPRKVLVGTMVCGPELFTLSLERRLQRMDESLDSIAAQAKSGYPGKRLDLVILPEAFLSHPGDTVGVEAVRLSEVQEPIAAGARRLGSYLIVPMLLNESGAAPLYSNVAVLFDRSGKVAGIYRKVHPVAPEGSDVIETGTKPGGSFPVFDCDFGRVGIQICFDMLYADGWAALAKQGAEIVALPTASPQTTYPSFYAQQHRYYVVSAAPRDHAAFYSPVGLIETEVTQPGTLVHEIDLSYALIHWESFLEEGQAFARKYGDRAGFLYYRDQDEGIFWSNDPAVPIGKMLSSLGLREMSESVERIRRVQDTARGGAPLSP